MKALALFLALTAACAAQPFNTNAYFRTTAAPAGYTFKPTDITSGTLKLWLYADTLKTLESKAVGDTLYRWQDLSGNAYHMVNTTASQKPVLRDSATVWGKAGGTVQFDGSDDYLTRSVQMVDTSTGWTVFTVQRLISFNGQYKGALALQTQWRAWQTVASNNVAYLPYSDGFADASSTRDKARYTAITPVTRTGIITTTRLGTSWSMAATGARLDSAQSPKAAGSPYDNGANANYVGSYAGTGTWNGHIMEVIVYAGVLPITDIRKVEEYLRRKYSL